MKRAFALAGLLALLSALAGCGGGGGINAGLRSSDIVGTWRATQLRAPSGATAACPGSIDISNNLTVDCGSTDEITFRSDGTFTNQSDSGGTVSGTWTLNGSTLSIATSGPGTIGSVLFTAAVSGNTLTLTFTSGAVVTPEVVGVTETLVKQ